MRDTWGPVVADRRQKNMNWYVADANGKEYSTAHIQLAVLMDLRDELKALNVGVTEVRRHLIDVKQALSVLHCPNFQAIPRVLKSIRANTAKPRKKRIAP